MKPEARRSWVWVAGVAGAALFLAALIWGPWLLEGRHVRDKNGDLSSSAGIIITGLRTAVIAIAAGAIAALGLWYTHKNHELSREEQVTDRYVEAIKLLGSENLHERLGGIYSLERIMKDSEKDHATIIEVLAAFIRTPSSDQWQRDLGVDGPSDEEGDMDATVALAVDVSAALTVVGRRPNPDATPIADLRRIDWSNTDLEHANLQHVDLTGADLRGARLKGADLRGSDLTGARLRGADFQGAHLTGAGLREVDLRGVHLRGVDLTGVDIRGLRLGRVDLTGAQLRGADLTEADLRTAHLRQADFTDAGLSGANLGAVDLTGTVFRRADLRGAHLGMAHLVDADLREADLRGAQGLTTEQLRLARLYDDTKIPKEFKAERSIRERIKECKAESQWRETATRWREEGTRHEPS
ncbi:pentapeptide repeat-containing protein [Streptomyces sp. NPDC050759]|uniref:pentapeptide repeat-containing protein n=1 Tax=Streptomyces sp. NPDC050759 TaxID=3365635 RepID=UPI0037A82C72